MNASSESLGARLRRARELKSLSVQKAADELRLDAWAIEAIENDQYERVGPAVYAKGHLKKYAQLLGLPLDEVLAGYQALQTGMPVAPPAAPLRVRTQAAVASNLPVGQFAAVGLLLLVIAAVLWWKPWQQRVALESADTAPASTAGAAAAPPAATAQPSPDNGAAAPTAAPRGGPADSAGDPDGGAPPGAAPSRTPTAGNPRSAPADGPTKVAAPAVAAANAVAGAGAGHARLRMSFSADSWVDVRDATGKQVWSGNGRANSVKTIVGDAPLRIYLGYANGVQLEINERAVAIAPAFVSGDAARFQAGADGVLRSYSNNGRPRG
jgi:cytoskeleton protein RodZ